MHNYNPINKYSKQTRMGNWSEEWDLEEVKYGFHNLGAKSIFAKNKMEPPKSPKNNESS